jgi:pyruvate/2-oxoglutarate dehydrogenase complex dihydrolipoamide dehydrogenase (E3) component
MDNRKVLTGEILFDQLKKYMKITGAKLMTKLVTRYVPVGKWVVIMGGGIHGCQTAEFLIKRGRKVTIVESGPKIGDGLLAHWLKPQLLDWLEKKDVVFLTDAKYEEVTDKGLTVSINGERQILEADTVITALPLVPNLGLVESLKGIAPEIYAIGDCNTPSYIANAVEDGSYLARQI